MNARYDGCLSQHACKTAVQVSIQRPAAGLLTGIAVVDHLQSERVADVEVAGVVLQEDGMNCRNSIQFVAGRMSFLGQSLLVIAETMDDCPLRQIFVTNVIFDISDDVLD